jgi:hypothetical protein
MEDAPWQEMRKRPTTWSTRGRIVEPRIADLFQGPVVLLFEFCYLSFAEWRIGLAVARASQSIASIEPWATVRIPLRFPHAQPEFSQILTKNRRNPSINSTPDRLQKGS